MPLQPKNVRGTEIGGPFLDFLQKIQTGSLQAFSDLWTTLEIREIEVGEGSGVLVQF